MSGMKHGTLTCFKFQAQLQAPGTAADGGKATHKSLAAKACSGTMRLLTSSLWGQPAWLDGWSEQNHMHRTTTQHGTTQV